MALVQSSLAVSDAHVGTHWKRFLLPGNLSIAVEQNRSAALVLVQQAAVLEVSYEGNLALQVSVTMSTIGPLSREHGRLARES